MGLGTGALMQNLVLVVQNTVDVTDVGAACGVVTFFRSLGGTIGVAALGAVLANGVTDTPGHRRWPGAGPGASGGGAARSTSSGLPASVATIVRTAYADATAQIFLIAGVIAALLTLVAVALMPVTELRTTIRKVESPEEPARRRTPQRGGRGHPGGRGDTPRHRPRSTSATGPARTSWSDREHRPSTQKAPVARRGPPAVREPVSSGSRPCR